MSLDKTFDGSDAHLPPADAAACVAFLRGYQEWRRWIGAAPLAEEGPAMPHPKSIGFAIDMAIRLIEERVELLAALEEACVCIGYSSIQEVNLQQMADAGHKKIISLLNFRKLIASMKGGA